MFASRNYTVKFGLFATFRQGGWGRYPDQCETLPGTGLCRDLYRPPVVNVVYRAVSELCTSTSLTVVSESTTGVDLAVRSERPS